jgi:DNA processing protein
MRQAASAAAVRVVWRGAAEYPSWLGRIHDPPGRLWVRGTIDPGEGARSVAIVGARTATPLGESFARVLSADLAAAGLTIVSGLARGIDTAAHVGALEAGGRTVAILGSGIDRPYPRQNAGLAEAIARTGALVSEFPPGAEPWKGHFPRRNRTIAGWSRLVVVVEAGERSGALITASWALEQGRAVFAVPGPLGRSQSTGCNRLLRAHPGEVRIVAGMDELLEDLDYGIPLAVRRRRLERSEAPRPDAGAILARLGPAEAAVVRRLLDGPATADALAGAADLAAATVLAVLTRLEEEGLVAGAFGRYRLAGALAGVRAAGGPGLRTIPGPGSGPAPSGPGRG